MKLTAISRALLLAGGAALAVSACSGNAGSTTGSVDPGAEAESLIEEELAEEAALGPLTARCSDAGEIESGGSFECTGTTDGGQVIEFTAEATEDGVNAVNSTNLATPEGISVLAEEAAMVLSQANGVDLPADAVTCDDSQGLIIDQGATLDCQVTDPETGGVVAAVLTITDPENPDFAIELTG